MRHSIIAFSIFLLLFITGCSSQEIISVNIILAEYTQTDKSLTELCDRCFQNSDNPAACVGFGIDVSFNLQIDHYATPVYCKVTSSKGDLTNVFESYQGSNGIDHSFGNELTQRYLIKVCCSQEADFSEEIICSQERNLDERCLIG
ncbi:MAG: hypothetical protein ABIC04_05825 [Nanoarchaeota archaeon]